MSAILERTIPKTEVCQNGQVFDAGLIEKNKSLKDNKEYTRLRDFYDEMQKSGGAKKPEYDLPPLDTIGRNLYEMKSCVSKKKIF